MSESWWGQGIFIIKKGGKEIITLLKQLQGSETVTFTST